MMTPPPGLARYRKTLDYVVDIKGNQRSVNLAAEVQTIEELRHIASVQRKLMQEIANIATDMQENYIQVQTLLAMKLAETRDLKTHLSVRPRSCDIQPSSWRASTTSRRKTLILSDSINRRPLLAQGKRFYSGKYRHAMR